MKQNPGALRSDLARYASLTHCAKACLLHSNLPCSWGWVLGFTGKTLGLQSEHPGQAVHSAAEEEHAHVTYSLKGIELLSHLLSAKAGVHQVSGPTQGPLQKASRGPGSTNIILST